MMNKEYRFKFYLNARHEMSIDSKVNNVHPHTWEFNLYFKKKCEEFIQFSVIEKELQFFLSIYEGHYLNEIPPFDMIEPSLESIGTVLYEQIKKIMSNNNWTLLKLEISENPSRTFIIYEEEEAEAEGLQLSPAKKEEYIASDSLTQQCATSLEEAKEAVQTKEIERFDEVAASELAVSIDEPEINIPRRRDRKIETDCSTTPVRLMKKAVLRNALIVLLASAVLIVYITSKGYFPWGSDTWGHLFKSHLLYQEVMQGNYYPVYTELWYNGVQPFRYWAPLPYYILLIFEVLTKGNTMLSYNLFLVLSFIVGASGWLLWGAKTGRNNFALALALIWFFMPDNARVMFSEGNIPRVVVTNIFPFLLYDIWNYVEHNKKSSIARISLYMFLITLSHAMIAAMAAITITIFVLLYGFLNNKKKPAFEAVFATAAGIALSGFWLYPALRGGLTSLDSEAVGNVMKSLTFPISQSLNPGLRFGNSEIYYFGLSVCIISLLGIVLGNRKSKAGFFVTIFILLGTTTAFLFLFEKLPMAQLFWMMRFTPLAYGVFFAALLLWKNLKKVLVLCITLILIADCWASVQVLCYDVPPPRNLINAVEGAAAIASQRIAVLDSSEFGSFPTYHLAFNDKFRAVPQVYGWAWQGAKTSQNIMWINTAFEKGWYEFMFDRCLELGADTLVIKKDRVAEDYTNLLSIASEIGYIKQGETPLTYIFKYPVDTQFGTKTEYKGLGIGKHAANLGYIFPSIELGTSEYIDSYTVERLTAYKVLFLSGFKYKDKSKAEDIVRAVSKRGTRIIIDMTGAESELSSSREEFLEVRAQPVLLKESFPILTYDDKKILLSALPEEYTDWRTSYLENLDNTTGEIEFNHQYMSFLGNKVNENITFIGLNLPFYALETRDRNTIDLLERITGLKSGEISERTIVAVEIKRNENRIDISTHEEGVIIGNAYLDAFSSTRGELTQVHNLVKLQGKDTQIQIITPYTKEGIVVSMLGFLMQGIFFIKKRSAKPTGT